MFESEYSSFARCARASILFQSPVNEEVSRLLDVFLRDENGTMPELARSARCFSEELKHFLLQEHRV